MSYPDLRQKFQRGDPVGPSAEDLKKKYILKRRKEFTGPGKFGGPFREQNFNQSFAQRHPKSITFAIVSTSLAIFFGPFIYDVFFKTQTLEEQYIAELKKRRMKETGVWYSPFNVKPDGNKPDYK